VPATDLRGRRQLAPTVVVLAYLVAAAGTIVLGDRVSRAGWLALHLVLLGGVTNAILAWSEHFSEALLHARGSGARTAMVRIVALNLAVLAVLAGVHGGRTVLVGAGGGLLAIVVLAHAAHLSGRIRRALPTRLGDTVWFYVAAATALVAATGLGMLLGGGAAGSGEEYRAIRLAHAHLNILGWIGLTVLGTQFTLWPTVLRTRMAGSVRTAVRWSFLLSVCGLAVLTTGLLGRHQAVAAAGLAGYAAGLGTALWPFLRTLARRPPHNAASWMLAAGMGWFSVAVAADLVAVLVTPAVADLDGHLDRLVPVVAVGFGVQVLTGALTYLLPAVWGRGASGNRGLTRILELGWPVRVAGLNAGVGAVAAGPADGALAAAGQLLIGVALGSFVVLAIAALAWRIRNRVPT
jgi:nitrite reductase (NO-forming)